MIEIIKYPCNDRLEAEEKEDEMMKELKANLNMRNSYVSEEENRERTNGLKHILQMERQQSSGNLTLNKQHL